MLKIRLRREGSRNHPFYRLVVSDSRYRPTGRMVEIIGHYDPRTNPPTVVVDMERYENWVRNGAEASDTVRSLIKRAAKAGATA